MSVVHLAGISLVSIGSPELFEECFVNLAKWSTKEKWQKVRNWMLFGGAIFFKLSEEADFSARRKALASSLFKNKLTLMMHEIKRVTLDHIREYKDVDRLDIGDFFKRLQTKIIF